MSNNNKLDNMQIFIKENRNLKNEFNSNIKREDLIDNKIKDILKENKLSSNQDINNNIKDINLDPKISNNIKSQKIKNFDNVNLYAKKSIKMKAHVVGNKLNLNKNKTLRNKKEIKKEEFIKFYINDNIKNNLYNFKDNTISTTKYNIFTFIPKGLLYQFSRWSNVYFLFTAIIQSIPLISPLTSVTAIIPLIFVLGVSLIREAIEDFARNNFDYLNNEEEVIVYRNNKFVKSNSKTLRLGEIILVYENQNIPTDMILIDTGYQDGICYVETSSLDGEKNLKFKVANKYTKGFINNDIDNDIKIIDKYIQPGKYFFSGEVRINAPNTNLNYINGTFHPKFSKKEVVIDEKIHITNNEFILKSSILKNTSWIIGIVAYTGMNNKIILNSKKPRLKMSKVEKKLNIYLLFTCFVLIMCCLECSLSYKMNYKKFKKYYNYALLITSDDINANSLVIFFTYFLLLNTLIPISLIVSIEIIKIFQGIFIEWDVLLYSKWRHFFCSVKTFSIIEELGNVNFIFCDKTGTLTKNELQFKYCIIDNKYYKYIRLLPSNKSIIDLRSNKQDSLISSEINSKQKNDSRKENKTISDNNKLLINETNVSNIINNKYSKSLLNIKNKINIYNSKQESLDKKVDKIERNKKIIKTRSLFSIGGKKNIDANNAVSNNKLINRISNKNINKGKSRSNKASESVKKDKRAKMIEESEFFFSTKGMIEIEGGYFSNPKNNPFLSDKKLDTFNVINYAHEFWVALSLANECMIKYENNELKYIGTSQDDLELVKAASEQGYKLIGTSVDSKTLKINGESCSYEVLKVLGFSSERKRMSIIVKYQEEIILYIKGADSEISKRLSKKALENENYKIISDGLIEFSKQGLRTLMIAFRKIKNEDYTSWVNQMHEDECNAENKKLLIDKLYDVIENDLTLIGGTVVEDKLQDNVPQTIKELKSAGIKIWILTGDKLDTAKNIGYGCHLLTEQQKIFELKVMKNGKERERKYFFKEINKFFEEFHEFIIFLVKKYNLESKFLDDINFKKDNCINYGNIEIINSQSESQSENESNKSNNYTSINLEIFHYLKEKKLLEPYSIIIEAPLLIELFNNDKIRKSFLKIAYNSNTVICCRVSPSQKSQIIKTIKNYDKKAITLAIGDGSNDISMIMEANIGIGIYGEEGTGAVQASDFAIGEFQLLKRLLFVHGRTNLYRITQMIIYFFYKNFIFSFSQFYYSTRCLASGQTIIDDWYITCYNLIFTSIPLCVRALTDSDIDLKDKRSLSKNLAFLYKENRDKNKTFTFKNLILNFIKGIFFSLIFYLSGFDNEILIHGYNKNMSYVSLRIYLSIIIVVTMTLLIQTNFISYLLPIFIGITTVLLLIIFLILNHFGYFFNQNSKGSLIVPIISLQFILGIFLIAFFNFVFEYSMKFIRIYFNNTLSSKLILSKYNLYKKRTRSLSSYNKSNNSFSKNKIKENEIEKSNNSLISKNSFSNINLINDKNRKSYLKYIPNPNSRKMRKLKDSFFL